MNRRFLDTSSLFSQAVSIYAETQRTVSEEEGTRDKSASESSLPGSLWSVGLLDASGGYDRLSHPRQQDG
jgi:hypothetical protein